MKYFVVSDVHGHLDELISALHKAGFDVTDKNHTLVTAGDLFDRGPDSRGVFEFVSSLNRCIPIMGNHDMFLLEMLSLPDDPMIAFNMRANGLLQTVESFIGRQAFVKDGGYGEHSSPLGETTRELRNEIVKQNPKLESFMSGLPMYLETKTHIITHAGFDTVRKDWRESSSQEFLWTREMFIRNTEHVDKTIVYGHTPTHMIRERILSPGRVTDYSLLKLGNQRCIDGGVYTGGEIIVYTFEE